MPPHVLLYCPESLVRWKQGSASSALGVGFGLEGGDHRLDRNGVADSRSGDCQDVTFGLAGVVEAAYGHSVVQRNPFRLLPAN